MQLEGVYQLLDACRTKTQRIDIKLSIIFKFRLNILLAGTKTSLALKEAMAKVLSVKGTFKGTF